MAGEAGTAELEVGAVDYEASAKAKGWKPQAEYEGDVASWVDAEEFVKREPLFEKIRNQSKELKEMRKTVEAMTTHFQKNVKAATDKAIGELKERRREAIELGDAGAVDKIDEQIAEQKAQVIESKAPEIPHEVKAWVQENPWFDTDEEMRIFAISYSDLQLRKNNGDLEKSLEETAKAVRKSFPEKFENKKRNDPPSVAGGSRGDGDGKGKYTTDRLSPEQKLVYKQFVQQHKIMSHEDYFKGLEDQGDLK